MRGKQEWSQQARMTPADWKQAGFMSAPSGTVCTHVSPWLGRKPCTRAAKWTTPNGHEHLCTQHAKSHLWESAG